MSFSTLLFLFIATPLVELALLLKMSEWLGWVHTVALVIVTGVIGASMARQQGLSLLLKIQGELNQGMLPAPRMIDGLMILAAGLLLITPGLITDAVGFALLVPPIRKGVKRMLKRWFERKIQQGNVQIYYR